MMKRSYTLVLIISAVLALAAPCTEAQVTTANGPYYATPSWDQQLPVSTRFIVLANWSNAAVLDRETGLIWERSPLAPCLNVVLCSPIESGVRDWFGAQLRCNRLTTGGRLGWRLPTTQELASLLDPSVSFPGLALPAGHPFTNVQLSLYWSATSSASFAGGTAWFVFFDGDARRLNNDLPKQEPLFVWCVRGGQGVDPQ